MIPFLKWAGGKRWLFTEQFVNSLPDFDRYVEPFLGGGAGFFAMQSQNSLLSDVNSDLIDLYKVIRDKAEELISALEFHQENHSTDYYYLVRSNVPEHIVQRAARTLYLNRTCWNGLYRLNQRGQFNVPIGTKSTVMLPSDNFQSISILLASAELKCCDFEVTIDRTGEGDLVFVDPPYTVAHNQNGFVKYNEKIFSWADQVRLRNSLERAANRGASIIMSNANHSSISELYQGFGEHNEVARRSVISSSPKGRGSITELIVRI